MRIFLKLLGFSFVLLVLGALAAGGGLLYLLHKYGNDLPDYRQLADYQPPTVTRIHAGDGSLLAEYAQEKRVFVPIESMPERLIQAFLAAEDKNFYTHVGLDPMGILRAVITNIQQIGQNRRPVGASTITQQVAKNFLLSNEVSYIRKFKEALLALRIERTFSKDEILELYLNEIYLGVGSYGVAAAALNYFNKSLDDLTTAETAFLAGLPKAPSRYHPVRAADVAKGRRDWVIGRLLDLGMIDGQEAQIAREEPLVMIRRDDTELVRADYFTESVRRRLIADHGESALYEGGLSIRTTILPALQTAAERALHNGLIAYDRRHGWRGPAARLELAPGADWQTELLELKKPSGLPEWTLGVVLVVGAEAASIGLAEGRTIELGLEAVAWARAHSRKDNGDEVLGPEITAVDQVLVPGDVIWVEEVPVETDVAAAGDEAAQPAAATRFELRQAPAVEGAIVAIDPHNGRVLAMSGGFDYQRSEFNRATQARRQPGSALKPFVYLAGFEQIYTPSSTFLDAPVVYDQGPEEGKWKPENYSNKFYGTRTLRFGLERSLNVLTVRLAQEIGMGNVIGMAKRFGLSNKMEYNLASALGSSEANLMKLTTAYAMLVNGGKKIEPALIERIQDRHGRTVARRDNRSCQNCRGTEWTHQAAPVLADERERIIDEARAYQMVNILEGVVERGTGQRAKAIGKPVAGKTGTSNDSRDAWFLGFTPDFAVGVYVGFDVPRPLGNKETGSSAALPIFVEFMTEALADKPPTPFRVPPGIRLVRVDADSGLLPGPSTEKVILEAFIPGTEPREKTPENYDTYQQESETVGVENGSQGGFLGQRQAPAPSTAPRAGGLY
ncbi:MAG: penicillin-binding protein 1A [Pseudomonadota bacterium]